jgi:hypothetical protein
MKEPNPYLFFIEYIANAILNRAQKKIRTQMPLFSAKVKRKHNSETTKGFLTTFKVDLSLMRLCIVINNIVM